MAPPQDSARVDTWIWCVRLVKTRSQATDACRAGHVRVNGERVKPAHAVRPGDEIRVRLAGRERVVVITRVVRSRVGAPVAAECYTDHSPPVERQPAPLVAARDRGAGRPTKRDRRALERLRGSVSRGSVSPGGVPQDSSPPLAPAAGHPGALGTALLAAARDDGSAPATLHVASTGLRRGKSDEKPGRSDIPAHQQRATVAWRDGGVRRRWGQATVGSGDGGTRQCGDPGRCGRAGRHRDPGGH
ncbi:ribosome-associated heat shock protein Hsp15 [Frankia sp. AiPs1]